MCTCPVCVWYIQYLCTCPVYMYVHVLYMYGTYSTSCDTLYIMYGTCVHVPYMYGTYSTSCDTCSCVLLLYMYMHVCTYSTLHNHVYM